MSNKKVNTIIRWWVTPKLPFEDIFEKHNFVSQWVMHPIKRRLARAYIKFLKKFTGIKIIGVTGSAGKSTTVRMIHSILNINAKTVSTPVSIDPVYNIVNTILKTAPWTKYLVLEMSVEYKREMDFYLWLAKPDMALVTNIYPTHTQFFGNTEGVYEEKKKIVEVLGVDGICILNSENKWTKKMAKDTKAKVLWFGKGTEIYASDKKTNIMKATFDLNFDGKRTQISLGVPGDMFVENAIAAAAVGKALKVDSSGVKKGLETFEAPTHRMEIRKTRKGYTVVDESYNSNPKALEASLEDFKRLAKDKKKIVILGDMLELGASEEKEHLKAGRSLSTYGVDYLIAVGKAAKNIYIGAKSSLGKKSFWVSDESQVLEVFEKLSSSGSLVLVKGSRSIGLEKVVSKIV